MSPGTASTGENVAIRYDRVCVDYGGTRALADFSLEVGTGRTVALLGPSGSGKSTALKALAGFERPSAGRVYLGGRDVTGEPPYARGLGVVVQQYALFPHMRVAANVAFGLRARRMPRARIAERVAKVLAMVGMESYARRYPDELSGGQQQRVAIGRALALSPDVLLMDEPLSALDAKLRAEMIGELQELRRELPSIAMLYVTHDQVEALSLADEIVIMRNGQAVDQGPAADLYRRPPSPFTASFLGDANLLPGVITDGIIRIGGLPIRLPPTASGPASGPASGTASGPASGTGTGSAAGIRTGPATGPATATGSETPTESETGPASASASTPASGSASGSASGTGAAAGSEAGTEALLCLRPHELRVGPGWPGRLTAVQWRGASYRLVVRLHDGVDVRVDVPRLEPAADVGDEITIAPVDGAGVLVPGAATEAAA